MSEKSDISAIILAAGFSSRMKQAKFSLMFNKHRTFLEKIIQEYLNFNCREIIVVMNSDGIKLKDKLNLSFPENVKFVLNEFPERERFFSLQIGLKFLKNINSVFIQNIDNPFVGQLILDSLYNNKDETDLIVPTFKNNGGHPIVINRTVIKRIISEKKFNHNLKEYLKKFTKKTIPVNDEKILININDKKKYSNYFK